MRRFVAIVALTLMVVGVGFAQSPVTNVSKARYANLAAAQSLSYQAYNKITAAQKANEWDLGGHAQKAKVLLIEVNKELKLAAEAVNSRSNKAKAHPVHRR